MQALELVTAALLDVLDPSNCLSLLNVATACGCVPLRRRARALALRQFSVAVQQDVNGLLGMEEPLLLSLLCSDLLQVRTWGPRRDGWQGQDPRELAPLSTLSWHIRALGAGKHGGARAGPCPARPHAATA